MALVKCKKCGKLISDKATSCVQCGYPTDIEKINGEQTTVKRRDRFFKRDSTNKIASICDWSGSTNDIINTSWGKGDELHLKMHTSYASKMDVFIFCSNMDMAILMIPLAQYDSYNERYGNICDCIYDSMSLENTNFELVGYNSIMCLGIGILWETIDKDIMERITEKLAKCVYMFRQMLENYGYDAVGFRLR